MSDSQVNINRRPGILQTSLVIGIQPKVVLIAESHFTSVTQIPDRMLLAALQMCLSLYTDNGNRRYGHLDGCKLRSKSHLSMVCDGVLGTC